jgi:hypothetical protein
MLFSGETTIIYPLLYLDKSDSFKATFKKGFKEEKKGRLHC